MFIIPGKPGLVLAPMEGVTDYPMRQLLGETGAFTYAVSEFIRVSQDVLPPKVFRRVVPELHQPSPIPVQVQILGGDPDKMAATAQVAVECGAQGIDINFGCPAATVNRHDGGATLLKHPCRLEAIVSAVRKALPASIPVSAKLRLGYDDALAIDENAKRAEAGGASWITIHGRTKRQGYAPPAYWQPIGRVRAQLSIPVVANGDIWSLSDLQRCREESGCDHFMIGRGALASPWLAREIAAFQGRPLPVSPSWLSPSPGNSLREWQPILQQFTQIALPFFKGEGYVARRLKQWVRMATLRRELPWFEDLKRLETLSEVEHWLDLTLRESCIPSRSFHSSESHRTFQSAFSFPLPTPGLR